MNTTAPHTPMSPEHAAPRREHPEMPETPDRSGDGREVSELARHVDPSAAKKTAVETATGRRRSGVEWVRPSDLLAVRLGRVAGQGIDFQAELARRARLVPGQAYRGTRTVARSGVRVVSERARRLPPVTAFGRGGGAERHSWVSRFGIGLG
ncbi:conserved hypothetical protein [Microbacterium sp. C448]|uniref:hypothetical protein n=1 Tax=Microbacterium sp. C448 TaxID=1177594 RepID=UPI0003DE4E51|nr:hypothetical protein [Microbacterium sp. C448]CDJ99386.1 conserved hypothetical protein [Microbacterium sp. C448]